MQPGAIDLLVIEDNPGDLRLLQVQLAEGAASFRISTAERLSEALKQLAERRFDAVLTDLHLPDSNGLDTVNAVRRNAAGAAVVVLSGSGDDTLAMQAVHDGAQDYLVKSEVTPNGLARTLRHAIERKKLERRLHDAVTGLERRVRERTAELEQYNTKLSAEVGERRAAESRVRQIGSLYAILSEVNEAIAHATDEGALFRSTCRAISTHEGYVAAGIGWADAGAGTIVPQVVSAGFEAVAQSLPISLDASIPEGRVPAAVAVREGRAVFAGNFLRDAAGGPWETLATQHQVRSVAALPLRRGGRVAAVFTIYSRRSEFFGDEERALVERLADNLSYALDHFDHLAQRDRAEAEARHYLIQIEQAMLGTVGALSSIVEQRDPYTSGHQRRVGDLAAAIGAEMALTPEQCRGLKVIGAVHDIGKIGVPAQILAKPGRLSAIEFDLIKEHTESGYQILKDIEFPWPVAEAVRQHHERLDGGGYPQGLQGEAIIVEARIIAVTDVVEAMATHRPYRPTLGIDSALHEIEAGTGTRYCERAATACLRLFRERNYRLAA